MPRMMENEDSVADDRMSMMSLADEDTMDCETEDYKNPLLIPEILHQTFGLLKYNDIKNCRLVCSQWNKVGSEFVTKLSFVTFKSLPVEESIDEFNETFENAYYDCPITSFQIRSFEFEWKGLSCISLPWSLHKFLAFFDSWGSKMTEFTMLKVLVRKEKQVDLQSYDLGPLLPSTLTKLEIGCESDSTKMCVPWEKLQNIKIVRLRDCILDFEPGVCISPVEIELTNVKFRHGNEFENQILIHELVDFKLLKSMNFNSKNIILDMNGSLCLETLSLGEVKLVNWSGCQWKINQKFSLIDRGLRIPNEMEYEELEMIRNELNYSSSSSFLDISALPNAIQRLKLQLKSLDQLQRNQEDVNLPFLKHVRISTRPSESSSTSQSSVWDSMSLYTTHRHHLGIFKRCTNLTDLEIFECDYDIPMYTLPVSLKRLLIGQNVSFIGDITLTFETVILWNHVPARVNKLKEQLQAKNWVWKLNREYNKIWNPEVKKIILKVICFDWQTECFVIGPFSEASDSDFEKSYLYPLVDKQGVYYCFKSGKGVAIDESEFNLLTKF